MAALHASMSCGEHSSCWCSFTIYCTISPCFFRRLRPVCGCWGMPCGRCVRWCLLLWCALHRPLAQMHLPPWAAMVGGGLLFALTYRLEQGYFAGMPLPAALWDREWLLWLGLPCRRLLSADYFPLLPWGGLFWAGCGLGQWLLTPPYIDRLRQSRSPGMARLGRHTLALYLCHQPVWFAGLWLLRSVHG